VEPRIVLVRLEVEGGHAPKAANGSDLGGEEHMLVAGDGLPLSRRGVRP